MWNLELQVAKSIHYFDNTLLLAMTHKIDQVSVKIVQRVSLCMAVGNLYGQSIKQKKSTVCKGKK